MVAVVLDDNPQFWWLTLSKSPLGSIFTNRTGRCFLQHWQTTAGGFRLFLFPNIWNCWLVEKKLWDGSTNHQHRDTTVYSWPSSHPKLIPPCCAASRFQGHCHHVLLGQPRVELHGMPAWNPSDAHHWRAGGQKSRCWWMLFARNTHISTLAINIAMDNPPFLDALAGITIFQLCSYHRVALSSWKRAHSCSTGFVAKWVVAEHRKGWSVFYNRRLVGNGFNP